MKAARLGGWAGACALVVLASRSLGYALSPRPDLVGGKLEAGLGGPRLVVVATVAVALAVGLSSVAVWLVSLAVRERLLVEPRLIVEVPPIRLRRLAARTLLLGLLTCTAFALLESYLHWRAGLGWHGVRCLVGPEHRDALPFLWSLSLVAAAVLTALEHLAAWMRRTLAAILAVGIVLRGRPPEGVLAHASLALKPMLLPFGAAPRGPPPRPLLAST